ncbi:MAG: nuclear transport factor 2 family protein [Acidobacteriota bacterium]|nr:nuclear transport factor 2 family protein [Acidobacteriota bacterium]
MRKICIFFILLTSTAIATAQGQTAEQDQTTPPAPVDVARSYFEAMDRKDLAAAEALFAKSSSIFETGGNEGDWPHYRDHHIGAELDAFVRFETSLGDPETEASSDGTMAFVAWPIEYRIELNDGRKIDSRGTVTFVLVRERGTLRIRHLHWSSRRK